jgi:hypothetical protein
MVALPWSAVEWSVTVTAEQSIMVALPWFAAARSVTAPAEQSVIVAPPWFAVGRWDIVVAPSVIVAERRSVVVA